jgi:hypothetical protein
VCSPKNSRPNDIHRFLKSEITEFSKIHEYMQEKKKKFAIYKVVGVNEVIKINGWMYE